MVSGTLWNRGRESARRRKSRAEENDLSPSARAGLTCGAALLAGAALFFLSFAAIFNGSWPMLILFLLGYAGAGALAVLIGGALPGRSALLLTAPAIPWVLWLFPASVPEAGLGRALLWPALVCLMAALAWLGGKAVSAAAPRRVAKSRAA